MGVSVRWFSEQVRSGSLLGNLGPGSGVFSGNGSSFPLSQERRLCLLLVLPVLTGMGIRRCWPDITKRHGRTLLGFSIAVTVLGRVEFAVFATAYFLVQVPLL